MKIGIVIFAGGEGRRIGGDKPRRLLAGRPLIDHVLERAVEWSVHVAIAARDPDSGLPGQRLLVDHVGEGPIAGLASAFRFARKERLNAVLTFPCDTPFLPADLLSRLEEALAPPARAAMAASGGREHPSCALWSAEAEPELAVYLDSGGRSLTGFARRLDARVVEWAFEPIDPFFNVNDQADLEAAEAIIRGRGP